MPALPALNRAFALSSALQGRGDIMAPDASLLALPEKAVQFGTGAFLRGFVDVFIDDANRRGAFGGRVVVVGSTGSGRDGGLRSQDGLYTLCSQGLVQGAPRRDLRVIGSISRALSAREEWSAVLACARDPAIEIIFSNTTEVGIALDERDEPSLSPPRSFPGKLTRFLYERATALDYAAGCAPIVLPCELIEGNGDRLREIVLVLAARWKLSDRFLAWVGSSVSFCNTLVDRIVPGAPPAAELDQLSESLGYRDSLITVCEPYRLLAIEGDGALRERLGFVGRDDGIIITPDVTPYRQRKVRLLNGTHTIMVSAALLGGVDIVRDAVTHPQLGPFLRRVLLEEIVPSLDTAGADEFAREVLDRFANPYINHALFDITLQGTTKMRVRVIPSIVDFIAKTGRTPDALAFGFAAWLQFMRGELQAARRSAGLPVPPDDQSARVLSHWASVDGDTDAGATRLVHAVCADTQLWGQDLTKAEAFSGAVTTHLQRLRTHGLAGALGTLLAGRTA